MWGRQVKADQGGSGMGGDGQKGPAMSGLPGGHGSSSGRVDRETGAARSRAPTASAVVDNAVYVDGRRMEPESLESTYELVRASQGMGWIGLYRPGKSEISSIAHEFGLHELAVEDALEAHQRPKLERYGDTLFVVLRPARYVDSTEEVEIGELHIFMGIDFVVTIRHSEAPDLRPVRRRLEQQPELLRRGPEAVLYAILDRVVDDYGPVLAGLAKDVDEIETEVFDGDAEVSRRIYQLSREVIEFQRAVEPLRDVFIELRDRLKELAGESDLELRRALRDVADHATRVMERIEAFRDLLSNILQVNAALVGQRQNEEMARMTEAGYEQNEQVKRISSWAAILFAPTLVASIYGMNFTHMPELMWTYGYPFALGLMLLLGLILYTVFKRAGWL